jgi:hypothetical protein
MRSDLFEKSNLEVSSSERFVLQNSQMLKVGLGPDILAAKGSMVAYQGQVQFHHEKSGSVAKLVKKVVTSENVSLMRVSGQGEVYFADEAGYIHLMHLENEGISINSRNILAFDAASSGTSTGPRVPASPPGDCSTPRSAAPAPSRSTWWANQSSWTARSARRSSTRRQPCAGRPTSRPAYTTA